MKKITLLLAFFITSFAFSQYNITHGLSSCYTDIGATGTAFGAAVGDDGAHNLTTPFDIYLGSNTSNTLRVGNNGAILFGVTVGDISYLNEELSTNRPMIAPFWDDFWDQYGSVYYQTFGSAPNRYFVIQWNRVHFDAANTNTGFASFQVVFEEANRSIWFAYEDVDMDGTDWDNGLSATIGISTSNEVTQFSFNTASVSNGTCLYFNPKQTYVPDDNFEAYLEANNMGNGIADDNYVYTASINTGTTLAISNHNINDLTGIEDFIALTELYCDYNNLSNLDVSQNPDLTELYCAYNNLSNLDVSQNTLLTELYCRANQLTNLNVSQNTLLTELHYGDNQLTNLNVSQNTLLTHLKCYNNQLTSLDVSQNTALTHLECDFNQLTSLDLTYNTLLTHLECDFNQLTSLDVSQNASLTELWCYNNQFTSLDVSQNTALTSLECNDNQLTSLNIANGNNTNMTYMLAYNNPILTCIQVDNAANTPPTGWDWQIDTWTSYSNDCSATTTYVPDDSFEAYLEANGMGNGIASDDYVLTSSIQSVSILDVNGKNIADLTGIEAFSSLTELSCFNNQLVQLNVSNNSNLNFLNCESNQLTQLDISNNVNLWYLFCGNNQLNNLDVSNNIHMISLWCNNNQLSQLDLSNNHSLLMLVCNSNNINTLNLNSIIPITDINCNDNQLGSIDISTNVNLEKLNCSDNQLTQLELSSNTSLTQLFCDNNQLNQLNISNNISLTLLDCSENNLTQLDASNHTALTSLWCWNNQLSQLDISNNIALTNLVCSDNNLTSLNIANGNNNNITIMWAYNNLPSLNCIQVDDAANTPPAGQDWQKDATTTYSDNCAALAVDDIAALGCSIYPNPASTTLNLEADISINKVTIYSMLGQVVLKATPKANQTQINISQLPTATYIVKLYVGEQVGSYKLIKK